LNKEKELNSRMKKNGGNFGNKLRRTTTYNSSWLRQLVNWTILQKTLT